MRSDLDAENPVALLKVTRIRKQHPPADIGQRRNEAFVNAVGQVAVRVFGWAILICLLVFLINNYLNFWLGWLGAASPFSSGEEGVPALAWLQLAAYPIGVALAVVLVGATPKRTLREDSVRISGMNTFLIRAAFFAVLYVGIADAVISFLRVEGLLPPPLR